MYETHIVNNFGTYTPSGNSLHARLVPKQLYLFLTLLESMNDVRDRVSELLKLRPFSSQTYKATDECVIKEECDMHGFSLVSQCSDKRGVERYPSSSTNTILDNMTRDQNWNNPGNVCLMCQAYHIEEAYRSVVFGQRLGDSKSTYLVLKSQQNQMFSDRYYNEGVAFKSRGLWSESVKSLADALVFNADNINARIERADCYFRQNRKTEAYNDYKLILAVQPNNVIASERLILLRNNTNFTPLPPTLPSTGTSVHSSSSSRIQLTDRNNTEYTSTVPSAASSSAHSGIDSLSANKNVHAKPLVYKNTNLICKLQQALLDNPNYFDTSSSSSSDNSSDSSSDSGDSRSSDRKSSRKRQRAEGKGSKKEHKAHKKKKSKHKKEKRSKDSKKRKKKHKSEK